MKTGRLEICWTGWEFWKSWCVYRRKNPFVIGLGPIIVFISKKASKK